MHTFMKLRVKASTLLLMRCSNSGLLRTLQLRDHRTTHGSDKSMRVRVYLHTNINTDRKVSGDLRQKAARYLILVHAATVTVTCSGVTCISSADVFFVFFHFKNVYLPYIGSSSRYQRPTFSPAGVAEEHASPRRRRQQQRPSCWS